MLSKIEVGKTYLDGEGCQVKIIGHETTLIAHRDYPFIGVKDHKGAKSVQYYKDTGRWNDNITPGMWGFQNHIVSEYKPPVFKYINIWDRESRPRGSWVQAYVYSGYHWDTPEEATATCKNFHMKRIALLKINMETGEAVNEKI